MRKTMYLAKCKASDGNVGYLRTEHLRGGGAVSLHAFVVTDVFLADFFSYKEYAQCELDNIRDGIYAEHYFGGEGLVGLEVEEIVLHIEK